MCCTHETHDVGPTLNLTVGARKTDSHRSYCFTVTTGTQGAVGNNERHNFKSPAVWKRHRSLKPLKP
ncbi:unnamed protein product, partial [Iphiclides podalirius]